MTFHVGQKVVCVRGCDEPEHRLMKGAIYTISGWGDLCGRLLYDVAEVKTAVPHAWCASRFRPLIERKQSISFTEGAPLDSEKWDNRKVKVPT